jgi:phage tail-like protein
MGVLNNGRTYTGGHYRLELDGINAGWVNNVEGGMPKAEVVTEKVGVDHIARKHIGGVEYEDMTFKVGSGMSKGFYQWLESTLKLDEKGQVKNGAVISSNYELKEMSRLDFTNARITEFAMPALDAKGKDPCWMTVKARPEFTRKKLASGGKVDAPTDAAKQKQWLPSNFRLKIDGLDAFCSRVSKVDALTIKQKVTTNPVGELREYEILNTSLEIPNLVITGPESHAHELLAWFEDFVVRGNCGQDKEKGGTLEYLNPKLDKVLFTIEFKNIGIFKCAPEKKEAHSEGILNWKAEMYVEEITLKHGAEVFAVFETNRLGCLKENDGLSD